MHEVTKSFLVEQTLYLQNRIKALQETILRQQAYIDQDKAQLIQAEHEYKLIKEDLGEFE